MKDFLLCPVSMLHALTNLHSSSLTCPRFTSGVTDKLGYLLMAVVVRSKLSRGTEVQLSLFHKIVYRWQQKLQISPNRTVWDHPKILLEMWTVNKGRGKLDTKELLSESKCNYWTKSRRRNCLRNLSFGLTKNVPKSLERYRQQRRNCSIRWILHWRKYISLSFISPALQYPNSPFMSLWSCCPN